jgi:hypothetical protein
MRETVDSISKSTTWIAYAIQVVLLLIESTLPCTPLEQRTNEYVPVAINSDLKIARLP